MDQPSFFHSFDLIRADGGSPLAGEPSSLSGSAGNVFVLPGDLYGFLKYRTPHNSRPAPSSIADTRRTLNHTTDNKPQPTTK
jgi:hypothetical protein